MMKADLDHVTILGCGVAGTWMAHSLATLGVRHFALFDGEKASGDVYTRSVPLSRGALCEQKGANRAEALRNHILRLNDDVKVETHGDFDVKRDLERVAGIVIGTMAPHRLEEADVSWAAVCALSAEAVIKRGHKWYTFDLPSERTPSFLFTDSPKELLERGFSQKVVDKEDLQVESAKAARRLIERHKG